MAVKKKTKSSSESPEQRRPLEGYQCEYSLMAQKGVQDYVGDLVTSRVKE